MNAISNVTVPDIGDFKDIPVIEILVKAGDQVAKDTPLVVLESDKATLDVPAPVSGTIKELRIAVGDRVSAGSLLLTLVESPGALSAAAAVVARPTPTIAPAPVRPVVASIDSGKGAAGLATTATAATPAALPRANSTPTLRPVPQRDAHASPSIRRIAREFGIALSAVTGTGPRGRIVRDDLHRFVKGTLATTSAPASSDSVGGLKLAPWPQIDFAKFGATTRAPLSKMRKISAANEWNVVSVARSRPAESRESMRLRISVAGTYSRAWNGRASPIAISSMKRRWIPSQAAKRTRAA